MEPFPFNQLLLPLYFSTSRWLCWDHGGADVQPDLAEAAGPCSELVQDYPKCSDSEVEPCRICHDLRTIVDDGPILEMQIEDYAPQYTRDCKSAPLQGRSLGGSHRQAY